MVIMERQSDPMLAQAAMPTPSAIIPSAIQSGMKICNMDEFRRILVRIV
jgi:hypothetical protein